MQKKVTILNEQIIIADEFPATDGNKYRLKVGSNCLSCDFNCQTPLGNICEMMPKRVKEMCDEGRLASWKKIVEEKKGTGEMEWP